jgi:hypothetical protein
MSGRTAEQLRKLLHENEMNLQSDERDRTYGIYGRSRADRQRSAPQALAESGDQCKPSIADR